MEADGNPENMNYWEDVDDSSVLEQLVTDANIGEGLSKVDSFFTPSLAL